MDYMLKGHPWPGRPASNIGRQLKSIMRGQSNLATITTVETLVRLAAVGMAYDAGIHARHFDAIKAAYHATGVLYAGGNPWPSVPGVVSVLRGALELLDTVR